MRFFNCLTICLMSHRSCRGGLAQRWHSHFSLSSPRFESRSLTLIYVCSALLKFKTDYGQTKALSFCFRNVLTSVIVWHNESSDTSIGNRLISWVINLNNWASKDKAKRASIDFSLAEPDNNNNNNNTGLGFIYCFVMTASFLFKAIDFVICGVCVSLGPIWCLSQQWHD